MEIGLSLIAAAIYFGLSGIAKALRSVDVRINSTKPINVVHRNEEPTQ